jgi:hypothetical protein
MNQFFDYIQPTIIKTSDNKELPDHLRNRFLLNFNVFGIKYFEQYYLLSESDEGVPYLIMNEQNWGIELENNIDGFDDARRIIAEVQRNCLLGTCYFLTNNSGMTGPAETAEV